MNPETKTAGTRQAVVVAGAGTRNRTADLLITNQLLYRLSYPGEIF